MAFLAAVLSGLVLLIAPHGGYQGGRNADLDRTVLYLSRHSWNDIHVWGSLAMIAGIIIHVALQWRWIVCMLGKLAPFGGRRAPVVLPQPGVVTVSEIVN